MSPARVLARLVGGVLLLSGAVWVGCLLAVLLAANRDQATALRPPVLAIIVLGAAQYDGRPSPVLRARLDHAVRLWQRGLARRLIVTGGRAEGDRMSEAAVSRRYAVAHGVPDSVILLEAEGRTTEQSLRAAAALLREMLRQDGLRRDSVRAATPNGLATSTSATGASAPGASATVDGRQRAILVSDPFHMLRLSVVARRYGIEPYTSPTRTSPISSNSRLSWRYMLGESLKVPFVFFVEKTAGE